MQGKKRKKDLLLLCGKAPFSKNRGELQLIWKSVFRGTDIT